MTSIFMVIGIVGWIALLTSIYVYKKAKDERLKSITIDDKESTDPNVVVIGGGTAVVLILQRFICQSASLVLQEICVRVEALQFSLQHW